MNKQREKSALVEFKEQSVQLRNEMEAERDPHAKMVLRFKLKSAKFWERLVEGLIFVLLLAFISGCHTFKGAMGDGAWLLQTGSDNIRTEK